MKYLAIIFAFTSLLLLGSCGKNNNVAEGIDSLEECIDFDTGLGNGHRDNDWVWNKNTGECVRNEGLCAKQEKLEKPEPEECWSWTWEEESGGCRLSFICPLSVN